MLTRRQPPLPARPFPLVLRPSWRCDRPNPRLGRLRALAFIATRPTFKRPAPYRIAAE
jgi:hypothetical protein